MMQEAAVLLLLGAQVNLLMRSPIKPMMKLMINVHGVVVISFFSYTVTWVVDEDVSSFLT